MRQEIVDEIKLKATSWKAREVADNHLRHVPASNLLGLTGSLGMTPFEGPTMHGIAAWKHFEEQVQKVMSRFTHSDKKKTLREDWSDWDTVQDDDVIDDPSDYVVDEEPERRQEVVIDDHDPNPREDVVIHDD